MLGAGRPSPCLDRRQHRALEALLAPLLADGGEARVALRGEGVAQGALPWAALRSKSASTGTGSASTRGAASTSPGWAIRMGATTASRRVAGLSSALAGDSHVAIEGTRPVYANQAWRAIAGVSRDEALAGPPRLVGAAPDDPALAAVAAAFERREDARERERQGLARDRVARRRQRREVTAARLARSGAAWRSASRRSTTICDSRH